LTTYARYENLGFAITATGSHHRTSNPATLVSSPVHCESTIIDKVKEIKKHPAQKETLKPTQKKNPEET
jgi:hypothetical protein